MWEVLEEMSKKSRKSAKVHVFFKKVVTCWDMFYADITFNQISVMASQPPFQKCYSVEKMQIENFQYLNILKIIIISWFLPVFLM